MNCSAASASTTSLRTVLIATARSMCGSMALYTTPIAPRPSTDSIRYLPRWVSSVVKWPPPRLPALRAPPRSTGEGERPGAARRCSGLRTAVPRSGLEHLHRLHEAGLHAAQRLGQHADLIAAAAAELAGLEVAEAHLVGEGGEARDAPDDHRVEHDVQQHERGQEDRRERQHEHAERLVGALDG